MTRIQGIQVLLGVNPDGVFGPKSNAALFDAIANTHYGVASVFADFADLKAFNKCKTEGKSDRECFAVGDNGIGASGKITAQSEFAMFALHRAAIETKWGSLHNGWGKKALIAYGGCTCFATLEDYMSSDHADIDLNPAAVKQLGISSGGMVLVVWEWMQAA